MCQNVAQNIHNSWAQKCLVELFFECFLAINLYGKAVKKFLTHKDKLIKCYFTKSKEIDAFSINFLMLTVHAVVANSQTFVFV